MRTDFTNIASTLNTLASAIAEMQAGLLAQANAEREEALALRARMCDTAADIRELTGMVSGLTAQFMDIEETNEELVAKVNGSIFGDIPECPYEDFVGFCEYCGETITKNSQYANEDGMLVCLDCFCEDEVDAAEDVAETETEIDEVEVIPVDETTDETTDETPDENPVEE